ncbi:hypothetical protein SteCoe_27241 [Stentor coeruleus]|uniref:Uncharacterized protein n=1 Tax=Stentor coeruleus TaxID=5963 RepID=A0A1R2BAY9_9CILI|nr:hypothetical protein SteCoe_27241 [Stentor coeruleus]
MNNINLGIALSIGGFFLNYASIQKNNDLNLINHNRSQSQRLPFENTQMHYRFYAACDDAAFDLHSAFPEEEAGQS